MRAGALGTKHVALEERQVAVSRLDKLTMPEPPAASRARSSGLPDDPDGGGVFALAAPSVPARAVRRRDDADGVRGRTGAARDPVGTPVEREGDGLRVLDVEGEGAVGLYLNSKYRRVG